MNLRNSLPIVSIIVVVIVAVCWEWLRAGISDSSRISAKSTDEQAETAAGQHADAKRPHVNTKQPTFERASNLLNVVDQAEGRHDVISLTMRARALDECRILAVSPYYFDQVGEPSKPGSRDSTALLKQKFTNDYLRRCGDLAQVRNAKGVDTSAAIEEAATAGSAWANAKLYRGESRGLSTTDSDATLKTLLGTGDADAIGVLADDMVRSREGSEFASVAGDPLASIAWNLASCDLGRDCTANGALMRQSCIFGGICSTSPSYRDLVQQEMLSNADFQKAQEMERAVLSMVQNAKKRELIRRRSSSG